jgi:hypothetical protein
MVLRIGWAGIIKATSVCCAISMLGKVAAGWLIGKLALYIALEKLSRVELLEDAWHTAPNHSRPQTCVAEVDVDAED